MLFIHSRFTHGEESVCRGRVLHGGGQVTGMCLHLAYNSAPTQTQYFHGQQGKFEKGTHRRGIKRPLGRLIACIYGANAETSKVKGKLI